MPRGQVNLLSCAKIVASLSYYQQGKGLGDALMHLIPPPTHLAYYQQGKGAADALMHIVLQPPPHMWTRLTSYLRWLILLRTRRDKGRGSSIPPHMHMLMYQYSNISPPSKSTFSTPATNTTFNFPASDILSPPLGGRVDMHGVVKRRH